MKFNKEYLVHINLDIPDPALINMSEEEYEAALKEIEKRIPDAITAVLCNDLKDLKSFGVKYAVETSEVKHGRWIRKHQQWEQKTEFGNTYFSGTYPTCSICGGFECGVKQETNFCPNCGARMDVDMEEKTEENNEIL